MKKLIFCLFLLSSCASVEYSIQNIKPNEYGFDESLANKVFVLSCEGNDYISAQAVNTKCKEHMSEFAYKKGYKYFAVLDQAGSSDTNIGSYTTSIPVAGNYNYTLYGRYGPTNLIGPSTIFLPQTNYYAVTTHSKDYLFVLVHADDLKNWKTYYQVSDYYTPKNTND